uniref:Uncharacterized protein n=1 Tax=Plectus sambesii TaxID=2011161 RepID=A0A914UNC1_9BILA
MHYNKWATNAHTLKNSNTLENELIRIDEAEDVSGVELGEVELGESELGEVELGEIELGEVELGEIELGEVELGEVELPVGTADDDGVADPEEIDDCDTDGVAEETVDWEDEGDMLGTPP